MRQPSNAVLASLALSLPAHATTRFVDASAPPNGNGASWQTAFSRLQDALATSVSGDELHIAQGLYKPGAPGAPRETSFNLPDNITLRGGYAGLASPTPDLRNPALFVSTLSGDLNNDDLPNGANRAENSFHVLSARNLAIGVTIDGLRIIGGNANGDANPQGLWDRGGGIYTQVNPALPGGPILRVTDCALEDNDAFRSAALSVYGVQARVTDTLLRGNRATVGGAFSDSSNSALTAVHAFIRCRFLGNAAGGGGAISCGALAYRMWLISCRFSGNTATGGGGAIFTGGNAVADARAVNCLFDHNTAGDGSVWFDDFTTSNHIVNCTMVDNVATDTTGFAIISIGLDMRVQNCILRNSAGAGEIDGSLFAVTHSNIKGGHTGSGNIDLDPLFRDAAAGDYRLRRASPCVDAALNANVPADEFDIDNDGNTAEPIPLDLAGSPRFIDDPASAPNGLATADMGALERQVCPGDTNDDNLINFSDLNIILSQFGQSAPIGALTGDVTGDGAVNFADLNLVLSRFGIAC